jgi:ferrous iron transport protein A
MPVVTEEIKMPLAFAPFGKPVKITRINTDDKTKRHLENLGLLVGCEVISLYDCKGDVILKIKDGKLALNRGVALKIMVG